jgi:cysteine dioxygenase
VGHRSVRLDDFLGSLRGLESEPITSQRVLELCSECRLEPSSLERYSHFVDAGYTRNLIFRDELFEVMLLCWAPRQRTPIHSHNGQLGWMTVERGALAVIDYKWLGCNAAENQNVVGLDCLAGATELDLERQRVHECHPGGPVATVDKSQTIHQVVTCGSEPAVSLHIYSRPIDSCVAYDLARRSCYRRQLSYYSRYGEVVLEEGDPRVAAPGASEARAD